MLSQNEPEDKYNTELEPDPPIQILKLFCHLKTQCANTFPASLLNGSDRQIENYQMKLEKVLMANLRRSSSQYPYNLVKSYIRHSTYTK